MELIAAYTVTLVIYACMEVVWLMLMTPYFYTSAFAEFSPVTLSVRSPMAIAMLYVIIINAFFWLVIVPIQNESHSMLNAFLRGAAFGSAVYGVYNLTNKATLPGYPWRLVILDSIWGTFLFSVLAIFFRLARGYTRTIRYWDT